MFVKTSTWPVKQLVPELVPLPLTIKDLQIRFLELTVLRNLQFIWHPLEKFNKDLINEIKRTGVRDGSCDNK